MQIRTDLFILILHDETLVAEQLAEVQVIQTRLAAVRLREQVPTAVEQVAQVEVAVVQCLEVHLLPEVQHPQDLVLQVEEVARLHLDVEVADVNF